MNISIKNNKQSDINWGYIHIEPNSFYELYNSDYLKRSYENYMEVNEFADDWFSQINNGEIIVFVNDIQETPDNGVIRFREFRNICSTINIDSIYKTNEDGTLIIRKTHGIAESSIHVKGRIHTCPAGQTVFWDIPIVTDGYKLADGKITIHDFHSTVNYNDYIEFSLIDKDNVSGLFPLLGLTVGQDILELGKTLETHYVRPEFHFGHFYGEVDLINGLYIRMAYNSFGNNDVTFLTDQYSYIKE